MWALLVGLTAMSWALGTGHGPSGSGHQNAGALILVIALVKVRLVGLHFMALRRAPTALRVAFELWCFGVCALTVVMFRSG